MKEHYILDIRTKIILLFFANYLLLKRLGDIHEWLLVGTIATLFILAGKNKKAYSYVVVYSVMFVVDYCLLEHLNGKLASFLSMIAVGGRVMLPCFMAGSYIFSTTTEREFINGLRKWHVPEYMIIPFAVMLRFLPTIKSDYQTIRRSLAIRGIFLSMKDYLLHPARYLEYILIPLLLSATRTASDLTIATLTKGIGIKHKKTIYQDLQFKGLDYGVLVAMVLMIVEIEVF
ncbi:energy-coupling factor transport system permease protein [Granulicatella balaenopterae]|uniref:Energy-coupling factor transport system permease protein n=1 Tax=Granulicatella balaenopterae TaxID=137733 RepID=A0A1H9LAI9_9LACT|nr:energy-coupling factor transporter transmembrane component T [Granulicatella balaenopterae]SER08380.1 energy-coupling factor transport system permease protein [Granulicatella balaenopterae]